VRTLPFGTWPSPLSPELLAAGRISMGGLHVTADGTCYWTETRPAEGGRQVVVRMRPGEAAGVVSPAGVSVRTRVHEYGGASFTVDGDALVYVDLDEQSLWRMPFGAAPVRISPPAPVGERHRYGEPRSVSGSGIVVAVRERHHDGGVDDEVVAVAGGVATVLVAGRDFCASPRPSPDGRRLAWVVWDLPNMPWDGSELWMADLHTDSGPESPTLENRVLVAGGEDESVGQPTWDGDARLLFVSDRYGWWQPFAWSAGGVERLCAEPAEFHGPDWILGQATMAPLVGGGVVCRCRRAGFDHLTVVDAAGPARDVAAVAHDIGVRPGVVSALAAGPSGVVAIAATPDEAPAVRLVDPADGSAQVLHRPTPPVLETAWVSVPRAVSVVSAAGHEIPALFFAPAAPDLRGPAGELPPLVVQCHGGPTASAEPGLDLAVQLWTTRGFAVAVVDYRGSTGHGRAYRQALQGLWGRADAEDCVAVARHLAAAGDVDGRRMLVRGSSAGGLTALACLAPGGPFSGALVSYGVTDLRALAADTHKFESRYLDRLVGPWPDAAGRYEERSPALHPEAIAGGVLLLQGTEDPIVPPDQARRMAEALAERGVRCRLELFDGEGHGFRRAETIARAADLELAFATELLGLGAART
jgi:dipeptidyl aminopeptidase/acylaminoacyl peptidase